MANRKIDLDFNKMFHNVLSYFKNLATDMIIAWSVLAVGIIILIIALML